MALSSCGDEPGNNRPAGIVEATVDRTTSANAKSSPTPAASPSGIATPIATRTPISTATATPVDAADALPTTRTEEFCGSESVTVAVERVLGGPTTCESGPSNTFRPKYAGGSYTSWTLHGKPSAVLTVGMYHYTALFEKEVGDLAEGEGIKVEVAGVPCLSGLALLNCFPEDRVSVGSNTVADFVETKQLEGVVEAALIELY